MQPVPCWEKVWGPPDGAAPGSTLRVYKWVKTDKKQVCERILDTYWTRDSTPFSNSAMMKAKRTSRLHPFNRRK